MICGPGLSHCVNEFEASLTCNTNDECEEESEDPNSKHHEQNKSRQNRFGCQVLKLVKLSKIWEIHLRNKVRISLWLIPMWIAQPSNIIQRKCSSRSSYSNFNQVVEEFTWFGMFVRKIALKNLQELKEVKVFIVVYYKTQKLQVTGMHLIALIRTKLNYSNFSQLKQVNFKVTDWW